MDDFEQSRLLLRVNLGCGQSPTPEWQNFDASPSVFLAGLPGVSLLAPLARRVRLLDAHQLAYLQFCRCHRIRFANALRRVPLPSRSCGVVYASHVLEHLTRGDEALRFLAEIRRLLVEDGIVRLAVPDLSRYVQAYLSDGDADRFVGNLFLARPERLRGVSGLIAALLQDRSRHRWVYDALSLQALLLEAGFHSVQALPAGETTIPEPGALDLRERAWESLYVEARR